MRFSYFVILFILFAGIFHAARAKEAPSADVQKAGERIKEFNGQFTLTPEHTIRTITFRNGSELTPEMFDLFAQQSDLQELYVDDYRTLNDDTVEKLAGLQNLRRLRLTNSGITDGAVRTIAESFPNLIQLDISSNSLLTDAALREIAKLKDLESLNLLFCDFSEFGILNIVGLPKLRAIDIRGNFRVGDGGLDALTLLPNLRNVQHRSPTVTDRGIRSLTKAKALDILLIQDMQITGQSGHHLRQMERLAQLQIIRCANFDSEGLLALGGLKLNRLTIRDIPIDDSAMEVFNELPTLRRLFLHELASITDAGLAHLAHLKDLELLDIWEVQITDKSLETISKLENLRTLVLRSTNITDAGVELLLTMPKLESVLLSDNTRVTPAMLQKLRDAGKFVVRDR